MESASNLWHSKIIDSKFKNKHRRSRDKLPRAHSSSTSTQKDILLGDDYEIILNDEYITDYTIDDLNYIENWQCPRCTFNNGEMSLFCTICELPYDDVDIYGADNYSVASSNTSTHSEPTKTITCALSNYIKDFKRKTHPKKRRKKLCRKRASSFKFDDKSFKQFKKFMSRRKTSIIAHKTGKNESDYHWNVKREERQRRNAQKLYKMYHTLYLSLRKNDVNIEAIINAMLYFVPPKNLKHALCDSSDSASANTVCHVCYADSNEDSEIEMISMNTYCAHRMICKDCFIRYIQITINDDENILPWLLCPAPECKAPIHPNLLLTNIPQRSLCKFAESFMYKHLQRSSFWVSCPDTNDCKCKFGWIVFDEDTESGSVQLECESCDAHHILAKRQNDGKGRKRGMDDGFAALIEQGIMRECPKCSYPAMKDYGMCNVMHCGKCGVYWNWRTKHTGSSTNEVKQKARNEGSLWEPGELAYQQKLQRSDLPAFIELLANNGIKYDPNYQRGT